MYNHFQDQKIDTLINVSTHISDNYSLLKQEYQNPTTKNENLTTENKNLTT
jgi:hypothetical protein